MIARRGSNRKVGFMTTDKPAVLLICFIQVSNLFYCVTGQWGPLAAHFGVLENQ